MDLSKEEVDNLEKAKQAFDVHTLTRQQVEFILRRNLNDKEWKTYETIESRKRKQTNTEVYSVKHLFKQLKKKPKKPNFSYSDIAKHAAKKRGVYGLNNNSKTPMKYTGLRNYLKVRKIVIE